MDPISAAGAAAATFHDLMTVVPPGGTRRYRDRQQRQAVYTRFLRAAHDADVFAGHLRLLQEVNETLGTVELQVSDAKIVDFMAAFDELRLFGNPGPRAVGEEIAVLLGELFDTTTTSRPIPRHRKALELVQSRHGAGVRRVPALMRAIEQIQAADAAWVAAGNRYAELQQALGHAHRRFVLAARDDLGRGHRWWHRSRASRRRRWQFWRAPAPWPGRQPPPTAEQLVTLYRAEATPNQVL
jgi:hypothetical protein